MQTLNANLLAAMAQRKGPPVITAYKSSPSLIYITEFAADQSTGQSLDACLNNAGTYLVRFRIYSTTGNDLQCQRVPLSGIGTAANWSGGWINIEFDAGGIHSYAAFKFDTHIVVCYKHTSTGEVYYRVSTDSGQNWGVEKQATSSGHTITGLDSVDEYGFVITDSTSNEAQAWLYIKATQTFSNTETIAFGSLTVYHSAGISVAGVFKFLCVSSSDVGAQKLLQLWIKDGTWDSTTWFLANNITDIHVTYINSIYWIHVKLSGIHQVIQSLDLVALIYGIVGPVSTFFYSASGVYWTSISEQYEAENMMLGQIHSYSFNKDRLVIDFVSAPDIEPDSKITLKRGLTLQTGDELIVYQADVPPYFAADLHDTRLTCLAVPTNILSGISSNKCIKTLINFFLSLASIPGVTYNANVYNYLYSGSDQDSFEGARLDSILDHILRRYCLLYFPRVTGSEIMKPPTLSSDITLSNTLYEIVTVPIPGTVISSWVDENDFYFSEYISTGEGSPRIIYHHRPYLKSTDTSASIPYKFYTTLLSPRWLVTPQYVLLYPELGDVITISEPNKLGLVLDIQESFHPGNNPSWHQVIILGMIT